MNATIVILESMLVHSSIWVKKENKNVVVSVQHILQAMQDWIKLWS